WRRGSLNPYHLLRTVRQVRKLYYAIKPDVVHHVAMLPSVVGSLAAMGLPIACLNAINGLGTTFTSDTVKVRATRVALIPILRRLLGRRRAAVLVQNADDRHALERLGIDPARISLIPGSGVDLNAFKPMPEPHSPITVAFVGR